MVTKLCLRVLLEAAQVTYQSEHSYLVWRLRARLYGVTKLESCNYHNQQINNNIPRHFIVTITANNICLRGF